MLGRAWRELLIARGIAFTHGDSDRFDITNDAGIASAIKAHGVTHVINCAAWTDVDGAEAHEAAATRINGEGVLIVARACADAGAMLVHYSTDYVFDGEATVPYRTDQPRKPLNAYGRSKAAGEEALELYGGPALNWLCLRTSWLYGPWGKNFVRTIAAAALSKPQLRVVNDQRGRPTSAEHLARASLLMIKRGAWGMHHVTDGGECTWFEFARHITHTLVEGGAKAVATVDPCASAEFPRPARRPTYSVLDLSRTESVIGPMPDWRGLVRDAVLRCEG